MSNDVVLHGCSCVELITDECGVLHLILRIWRTLWSGVPQRRDGLEQDTSSLLCYTDSVARES
jgi:hypothetical protein